MTEVENDGTPAALLSSIEKSLADAGIESESPKAAELLDAGEQLLRRVLSTNCDERRAALDLLTVDALFTRALEVAAVEQNDIDAFARDMMQRISNLGH